jgi:hypothetical protein
MGSYRILGYFHRVPSFINDSLTYLQQKATGSALASEMATR